MGKSLALQGAGTHDMYILLVSATYNELNTTIDWLKDLGGETGKNEIEVLITGVGSTFTAYSLTRQLLKRTPELVIQGGIAGTFSSIIEPGAVVAVKEEVFADLGSFTADGFDDIFDLGLTASDIKPFKERLLVNESIERWNQLNLPLVRGATINCISSSKMEIDTIVEKYSPDIESMEGAALHYVCISEDIPFIQLRAISNVVGERDKKNWMMKEAITALNEAMRAMLRELSRG